MVRDGESELGFGEQTNKNEILAAMVAAGKACRKKFHIIRGLSESHNVKTILSNVVGSHAGKKYTWNRHRKG